MTIVNGLPATRLMDAEAVGRILRRLAHEVAERHPSLDDVIIAAIREGGVPVARGLAGIISAFTGIEIPLIQLDVESFRDDRPRPSEIPALAVQSLSRDEALIGQPLRSLDGSVVILVDDVIQTGRTLRAALDLVASRGRPAVVEPLVLIDRGARELPIRATFVGKNVPVAADEWLEVSLGATEGNDMEIGVYTVKRA